MINGLTRRGVPLLLVVLPDGSRSLIPSAWTDWLGSFGIDAPGEVKDGEDLCAVGDLIKARAVIDALDGPWPHIRHHDGTQLLPAQAGWQEEGTPRHSPA